MNTNPRPSTGRQIGYGVAIFFLIVFLTAINNFQKWDLPVISTITTPAFENWLPAANLSLSVAIFSNFLFLMYDPRWFRHLMQAIQNAFSLYSTWVFYTIFPLNLPSPIFVTGLRWGLLIAMLLTVIAIIVETIQAISSYSRENK